MNIYMNFLLLMLCIICLYTDIKYRKIKNKIILPFITIFILFNTFFGLGFLFSIKGIFIGGFIPLLFSLGKGLGGGDIKLFATIGALNGYKFVGSTFVWSLLITIICSIIFNGKDFIKGIKNTYSMLKIFLITKKVPKLDSKHSAQTIPYSIGITLALLFNLYLYCFMGGDYICHLLKI